MKIKHVTIPVFIPELACPHRCIFCDQEKITGHTMPPMEKVRAVIDRYFSTINPSKTHVEIGFFGGNFTGIPREDQKAYLKIAQEYMQENIIDGIRLSTRPDYINNDILELLKDKGVTTIELGAQSMDDEVLQRSGRGHTANDTRKASNLIRQKGFDLGLQMMIGLPGDTLDKAINTAEQVVELGASNTRIYPTLVIKNTPLADLWKQDKFKPLTLKEAIEWSAALVPIFEAGKVNIIRMGLHPSEGILNGKDFLDGPFHPSLRELVMTELWKNILSKAISEHNGKNIEEIQVSPVQINVAIGYKSINRKMLNDLIGDVKFVSNQKLEGREYYVVSG
ncbi:MAG: radical SAM protein [Bacteroidales bacterium]|nr:radical SAM protein [Bacteroidales bacterium]